ncbi:MAG: AAA family ATPase [Lewinellaceae bacterium]|nr:AAA family ATPase [Saprospiraceae bacterium]MCB9341142.1 AAA family ATPase [Lewinellaceae bacterium]
MIIGITSLKGGVGKSTITQNLAVCFAHLSYKVVVVDTDTNQNTLSWFGARDKDLPNINVVRVAESEALTKSIENLHQDYDIVLIDGTPSLSKMATRIILASDILLIPIRPGAQDFRTMGEFFKRYEDAKEFRDNIPAYFVLNEYSEHKKVHEGISKQIESSFEVPVLKSKINSRVAYTEASVTGQGVFEYSDPKAKSEMVNLIKEVLEMAKELNLME